MNGTAKVLVVFALVFLLAGMAAAQNAPAAQGVPENAVQRISEHVDAIIGFPNIAIVTGTRGTLVVDTGMGPRNGAVVLREAQKLAEGPALYLTTTHFHPEHAAGEGAFPPSTVLIRPTAQQEELERRGQEYLDLFSSRSAQNKQLLESVKFRQPDIVFDREVTIDLGGVTTRLFWLGAAHTKGDELIFVEPDRVLIPGDIVQNELVPNMPNEDASPKGWLAILDQLAPLQPRLVVPDHGELGDGSLIAKEREFLSDLRQRALDMKRRGIAVDEAGKALTAEFKMKYPGWPNMGPVANVVRRVYEER